jgi:hypothetical protein
MMCFNFHIHFVFVFLIQTIEELVVEKHIKSVILCQNQLICLEVTDSFAIFSAIH